MAITRAQVETMLVARLEAWLTEAAQPVTHSGSNAALNDPIGFAARRLGASVADVTNVADSDLSAIATDDYDALFDLAEWRALSNLARQLAKVDVTAGPLSQKYSQLRDAVTQAAEAKRTEIEADYGFGAPQLTSGNIGLDITFKDLDAEITT